MKIEVGKFYKTRDGRKVGPMKRNDNNRYASEWEFSGSDGFTYRKDGTFGIDGTERDRDLISEWTDTPEVGTLQEIGAEDGDTVEMVESDSGDYVGDVGIFYDKTVKCLDGCGSHHAYEDDCCGHRWRIISRAQPKPEQTGPVRTVTRKEIVPGVYDRLEVGTTGPTVVSLKLPYIFYNADDVDKLLVHLTAIRDALKENGE